MFLRFFESFFFGKKFVSFRREACVSVQLKAAFFVGLAARHSRRLTA